MKHSFKTTTLIAAIGMSIYKYISLYVMRLHSSCIRSWVRHFVPTFILC